LQTWADAFPDPRGEPERGLEVVFPAQLAARFAGRYARRQAGYVWRSARVCGALGSRVEGSEPAQGLSWRGTSDDQRFRGDVGRKLLVQRATPADLSPSARSPRQAPHGAVNVRERASRRAVQQGVDEAEADARAQQGAEPLGGW
jgi:hypothetical protein